MSDHFSRSEPAILKPGALALVSASCLLIVLRSFRVVVCILGLAVLIEYMLLLEVLYESIRR